MDILKGMHLVTGLQQDCKHAMEQAALLQWQQSRVTFKFLKVTDKDITVGVTQANVSTGNYLNQKELIKVTHETFDKFFEGKRVLVHASPYEQSPALNVNPTWIKKKMEDTGTKLKQLASDTGMNYTHLSALVGGHKPLTDAMKALFYFYFLAKERE